MRPLFHDTNIADIEGLCKFSANPLHLPLLEKLRFLAERGALEFDLIMAHVCAIGKGYAILIPRFTEDLFSDELFCVLALIVFIAFAEGGETSSGAFINHVAHFHDSALYSVRRTETQRHGTALRFSSAVERGEQNKCSSVYIVHLDRIEHVVKRERKDIIVSECRACVVVAKVGVKREVVHGVLQLVVGLWSIIIFAGQTPGVKSCETIYT